MMHKLFKAYLLVLLFVMAPRAAWSQNSAIPNSSFNMGIGVSGGANTTVQSSAGEVLVGLSGGADTRVESGFLVVVLRQKEAPLRVNDVPGLPQAYALHQNYPNPFNPSTTVQFDLPAATDVRIVVYDLLGRKVVLLMEQRLEAGYHRLVWNGRDHAGRPISTGVYIVLMMTSEYTKSIKMVLLK